MTEPPIGIFAARDWQMNFGDRAALEGVLSQLRPALTIEIGSAQGGSLARLAAHSEEVHAIDPRNVLESEPPANVTFHHGDSRELLAPLLERFAAEGRNVDLALVDGDHSIEGVKADLSDLLASPAVARTTILLHDSFNPWVRLGIEAVAPAAHPKVIYADPDLVTGRVATGETFDGQMWGGFALVLVDADGADWVSHAARAPRPGEAGSADGWETAVRAAPVIASIRDPSSATAPSLRDRLRSRLRALRPER